MKRLPKLIYRLGILLLALTLMTSLILSAQEEMPVVEPTESPTEPLIPTDMLPVTLVPEASPEVTESPIVATLIPATPAPEEGVVIEPPLQLLVREFFDNGDLSPWALTTAWALVPNDTGLALQISQSAEAITYQKMAFYSLAVEARFLFESGSVELSLRQTGNEKYTISLNADGNLALYRGASLLQTNQVAANQAGQWRTLRVSALDNFIRVGVDNIEVLTYADAAPLPAGTISISSSGDNQLRFDDFFIWIPQNELGNYPAPTAYAPPVPTSIPTATIAAPGPNLNNSVKDLSAFPPPTAAEIANSRNIASTLGNDNFSGYTISSLPITLVDNTIGDTLEINESLSTCGFGLANTIWFSFTPATNATYTFSTLGSNFDTILALYTGSSVDSLSAIACNDDVSTTNLSSYISLTLNAGTTYRIQLGGFNGRYGNYQLFIQQLGLAIPAAPTLLSPSTGFLTNDDSPHLTWNTVVNASQYEVQVATNATFTANLLSDFVEEPDTFSDFPTLPATAGTIYYWRVRALNANLQGGAFSAVRTFTLDTAMPPNPNAIAPINNAISSNSRPTFSWAAVTGATSYLVDIDDDSDFSSLVVTDGLTNTTSFIPTNSLPQGTYYWRVQAQDAASNLGGDSIAQSFKVNILTAPLVNAVIFTNTNDAEPVLTWAAVTGASAYTVQIDDDVFFGIDSIVDEPLGNVTTYTVSPALATGTYYWQVIPTGVEQTQSVYNQFIISPPALAAPSLGSPANGANTNDNSPTMVWIGVVDALQYEIQWATNSTFTANVQSVLVPDPATTVDLPALPNSAGTVYYWRMRTRNSLDVAGAFSAYSSFTLDNIAPNTPNLTALADGALTTNSRPTFTWSASATATSYLVDIDDDSNFSSPIPLYNDALSTTMSFTLPVALEQGTYYWRVQAQDAFLNISAESVFRSFTIKILTAPANNAIIFSAGTSAPILRWAAVTGASDYTVLIDNDSDFSSPLLLDNDSGITTTSYTVSPALGAGIYYWQVRPTGFVQTQSVYNQFTISLPALAAPSLNLPVNAAKTNDTSPNLSWVTVGSAAQYEIQWATNTAFTANLQSTLIAHPTNNLDLPTLPATAGTIYYWRVRSINSLGVVGAYSAYRNFTLDTVTPATVPNLNAPANGALSTNSRPVLTWGAVATATSYLVDIDDDSNFTSLIYTNALSTTTSFTPPTSLEQGTYYWRVQARDAALNTTGESLSRSFTVKILIAPAANAVIFTNSGSSAPVLRWAAVTNATEYTVQVDDDTDFGLDSIVNQTLGNVTSFTVPPLVTGIYYWQVIPTNFEPALPIYNQFTISFAALAAPSLASPANAAKTNDTSPNLSWNTVLNAVQYEIQWATNSTFTVNAQSTFVTDPTNNLDFPTLPNTAGTVYYWRVRSINTLGVAGAYSAARNFTLDTLAPDSPILNLPADNTSTTNNRPSFQWRASTGAAYYEIRYGIDLPLTFTISNISTLSHVPVSPLLLRDYYWQVRAIDAAGNVSPWSGLRTVKIVSTSTAAPVLVRFTTTTPTLTWSPVTWTNPSGYYQVQVDNHSTFASPEFPSGNIPTGNQSVTTTALSTGTWYWRVRACTAANVCGAWSITGVFTVEE